MFTWIKELFGFGYESRHIETPKTVEVVKPQPTVATKELKEVEQKIAEAIANEPVAAKKPARARKPATKATNPKKKKVAAKK